MAGRPFSVLTRSQNAAALLASIVLFLVFFTSGAWNESIFFPFLNPQSLADHVDPAGWLRILVENRVLVLSLAFSSSPSPSSGWGRGRGCCKWRRDCW